MDSVGRRTSKRRPWDAYRYRCRLPRRAGFGSTKYESGTTHGNGQVQGRQHTSQDYVVAYDAPFEKLRAIKASTQVQDKSAGGRAVASAASFGLSTLASNENRHLFLTITTDRETYALKEKGGMLRLPDQAAMKLELAGQGILDALGSRAPSAPATPAPGSVADQLRDLAALHRDGVLTDEEFAAAKAKLLGS